METQIMNPEDHNVIQRPPRLIFRKGKHVDESEQAEHSSSMSSHLSSKYQFNKLYISIKLASDLDILYNEQRRDLLLRTR